MEKMFEEMGAYIDAHRQEMVDKLVAFANLEGHFTERENVMAQTDRENRSCFPVIAIRYI